MGLDRKGRCKVRIQLCSRDRLLQIPPPGPSAARPFGVIFPSLNIVFTNSRVLEPILCSKTSTIECAPTSVVFKGFPSESTGGQ